MGEQTKKTIGDYEILAAIDMGGEGRVFKAVCVSDRNPNVAAGEIVALKTWQGSDDEAMDAQFLLRTRVLRKLSHPGIVQYKDAFIHCDEDAFGMRRVYCLVMELVKGQDLGRIIKGYSSDTQRGMTWEQLKPLFEQCLSAMIEAQRAGIVHRDLKPANMMVTPDGNLKLIDFGIARYADDTPTASEGDRIPMSAAGFRGTWDYMAPDFVRIDDFHGDEQSDIFSLGVCFYQLLTGTLPFDPLPADTRRAQIQYVNRWVTCDKPPPIRANRVFRVMRHAWTFVSRSLSLDRHTRFHTLAEMAADFRKVHRQIIRHRNVDCYELLEYLAKGGFGEVYKARRISDGRLVAVKKLLPDRSSRRFLGEWNSLMKLNHPNLVGCLDFIEVDRVATPDNPQTKDYFLILEYLKDIQTADLYRRLKAEPAGLPSTHETIGIFAHLLDALHYVHTQARITHRDIKPGNLYAPPGRPELAKVLDFGIALDAEAGSLTVGPIPGTPDYMAPELLSASEDRGSPQSDLYAIGVCLFQALTGALPFTPFPREREARNWAEFARHPRDPGMIHFDEYPVFTRYPQLRDIICTAVQVAPRRRYGSAEAMARALEEVLATVPPSHVLVHCGRASYGLLTKLGSDADSELFMARDMSPRATSVVVRRFPGVGASGPDAERETREKRRALAHPGLIQVVDFAPDGSAVVLEHVDNLPGSSLAARLADPADFLLAEAGTLFEGYLSAVAHLHAAGVVHGGIRPTNLVAPAGNPAGARVLDGGAFQLHKGLNYAAPELADAPPHPGSDVYSLGVCLYETLTRSLPFPALPDGAAGVQELRQRLHAEQVPAFDQAVFQEYPGLRAIILKALASQSQARYASIFEMLDDLRNVRREGVWRHGGLAYLLGRVLSTTREGVLYEATRAGSGERVFAMELTSQAHAERCRNEQTFLRSLDNDPLIQWLDFVKTRGFKGQSSFLVLAPMPDTAVARLARCLQDLPAHSPAAEPHESRSQPGETPADGLPPPTPIDAAWLCPPAPAKPLAARDETLATGPTEGVDTGPTQAGDGDVQRDFERWQREMQKVEQERRERRNELIRKVPRLAAVVVVSLGFATTAYYYAAGAYRDYQIRMTRAFAGQPPQPSLTYVRAMNACLDDALALAARPGKVQSTWSALRADLNLNSRQLPGVFSNAFATAAARSDEHTLATLVADWTVAGQLIPLRFSILREYEPLLRYMRTGQRCVAFDARCAELASRVEYPLAPGNLKAADDVIGQLADLRGAPGFIPIPADYRDGRIAEVLSPITNGFAALLHSKSRAMARALAQKPTSRDAVLALHVELESFARYRNLVREAQPAFADAMQTSRAIYDKCIYIDSPAAAPLPAFREHGSHVAAAPLPALRLHFPSRLMDRRLGRDAGSLESRNSWDSGRQQQAFPASGFPASPPIQTHGSSFEPERRKLGKSEQLG